MCHAPRRQRSRPIQARAMPCPGRQRLQHPQGASLHTVVPSALAQPRWSRVPQAPLPLAVAATERGSAPAARS